MPQGDAHRSLVGTAALKIRSKNPYLACIGCTEHSQCEDTGQRDTGFERVHGNRSTPEIRGQSGSGPGGSGHCRKPAPVPVILPAHMGRMRCAASSENDRPADVTHPPWQWYRKHIPVRRTGNAVFGIPAPVLSRHIAGHGQAAATGSSRRYRINGCRHCTDSDLDPPWPLPGLIHMSAIAWIKSGCRTANIAAQA